MKKHLFLLCIAFTGITTYGQNSVPNGNFEEWTSISYDFPQNYQYISNSNNYFYYNLPSNVTKTTDAYHGTYAVQLTTIATKTDTSFGYFLNSNPNSKNGPWTGGMPYNQKPTGIRGWYKYNVATADSGTIIVAFSHGGKSIGMYFFKIGGNHSSYTLFNKTLNPALSIAPDSVSFGAVSCKVTGVDQQPHGIAGSTLILDSLSFTGVSSQPTWMNGDFESWQTQTYNSPANWYIESSNGEEGFNRTTDAAKGSYAIELKTYLGNNNNHPAAQPCMISTGYYPRSCNDNCHEQGGYPFSNQTDTLAFYYKYAPAHPKDSASININFIKNGSEFDGRYTILLASANYKYVEVPFNLSQSPDTVIIDIQSSLWQDSAKSYVGADLKIDEIYFKSQKSTGIHQLKNGTENSISIFPNPSNGKFQIKGTRSDIQTLKIFDVLGKEIYFNSKFNLQKSNEVDLSQFQKGIYFVKAYDGLNAYTEKIVIK